MKVISKYFKYIFSFIVILSILFGATIAFGGTSISDYKIEKISKISSNIFLDDKSLSSNIVIFTSHDDLSELELRSSCKLDTSFFGKSENDYYFKVRYNKKCQNPYLYLRDGNDVVRGSQVHFNIYDKAELYSYFSDYSGNILSIFKNKFKNDLDKLDGKNNDILKSRKYQELSYKISILNSVLDSRKQNYLIPVSGYKLPTNISKIPNAKRPYREKYTDGVHHSWDIDTPLGQEVIALDDGVIVRVVSDWTWSDFSKLKYKNLSYEDKLYNLDILRGNQVWLKSSKGDVVFYGHLDKIYGDIKEGAFVSRGQSLGTIGVSGVPDKNYKDYHLDFSIQKNPYNDKKAGNYSFLDYMKWDWYFKGRDKEFVLTNQYKIFKN